MKNKDTLCIDAGQLQSLVDRLWRDGYEVIGPVVRDEVIVFDSLTNVKQLPAGWTDHQEAGSYRLERTGGAQWFRFNVGPTSAKHFFHPEKIRLWRASIDGSGVRLLEDAQIIPKVAIIGLRSCELHAIAIQDKVFLGSQFTDEQYALRREDALLIAVDCEKAGATCFCDSMNTGPAVTTGFDLALTEITSSGSHRFMLRTGTDNGVDLVGQLETSLAAQDDLDRAREITETARSQMGRIMDVAGIKSLLQDNPEHPHWDDVASRCLTCANCTMVCPTCFCSTVHDTNDLATGDAERWRSWDSCFTLDFSYVHGGSVRQSSSARYRQWLTHKLAHWIDQFDTSGCVGCGRCITWCPVGIDMTAEVSALRKSAPQSTERNQDG